MAVVRVKLQHTFIRKLIRVRLGKANSLVSQGPRCGIICRIDDTPHLITGVTHIDIYHYYINENKSINENMQSAILSHSTLERSFLYRSLFQTGMGSFE